MKLIALVVALGLVAATASAQDPSAPRAAACAAVVRSECRALVACNRNNSFESTYSSEAECLKIELPSCEKSVRPPRATVSAVERDRCSSALAASKRNMKTCDDLVASEGKPDACFEFWAQNRAQDYESDRPCGPGYARDGKTCRSACSDRSQCASAESCTDGVCRR